MFCDGDLQVTCEQAYEVVKENCGPSLCDQGYCIEGPDPRCSMQGHYTVCVQPYNVECIDQYLILEVSMPQC